MAGVYDGLRVLDCSWGMAGPMVSMLLVDNGAAVTRIEHPDGDPFADQTGYRVWHRGKRRAALDLRSDAGRVAFLALADTVVDYRPATPKRGEGGPGARRATGFVLRDYTPAALLEALNRALTVFADPAGWRTLQTAGMQQDFSWDRSAQEYVKIYERALAGAGG